jgi:site-specific DNA recombinase
MCDFYAQADSLLADAVTRADQHHRESDADRRAEHDTIDTQISATEATITRYHAAFENGTMDDATAGPRIRALRTQLDQLTARRDDLTDLADLADDEPARPSPETLDRLRGYLSRMLTEDSSIERKSAIEARRSSGG